MEIGRLTAIFDADTRKFDAGARGVASKVAGLNSTFGSLTGGIGSASGALSGIASPLALAAGGAVVAATAIGGLAVGLFNLVKSSAEAGGELFDLSQKTGFTVETLSGLSIVAKTTGSDIQALSGSLVIFQKNQDAAADSNSKQGKLFRSLNIDIHDNEKALRQVFTALHKMGEGTHQTAVATQFFGRSGAAVNAIIKETNGNLDEAIKKYDKMGLIISTGSAAASDKFNDLLEETTLQLSAVTRSIGMELLPVATETLQRISFWLTENKGQWASWGTTISDIIRGVNSIAQSEIGSLIGKLVEMNFLLPLTVARGLAALGSDSRPNEDLWGPGGAMRGGRKTLPGTTEYNAAQSRLAGLGSALRTGGGGGKGGGGGGSNDAAQAAQRIAELQLQAVLDGLKREDDLNRKSLERRQRDFNQYAVQYMVIEEQRHTAVIDGLDKEQKAAEKLKKGRDVALLEVSNKRTQEATTYEENRNKVLDERRKILDQINDFLRTQERDIASITVETNKWDDQVQSLTDSLKEQGVNLEKDLELTYKRIKANTELAKIQEVLKRSRDFILSEDALTVGPQPNLKLPTEQESAQSVIDSITAQIGLPPPSYERLLKQMHDLGGELTGIFARSVEIGLNQGGKKGLASFGQSLLAIVEDVFLRRIAIGLGDILGSLATGTGGSGSGFWDGLLKSVLGAVFGGAVGGVGGGGATATRGFGTLGGPSLGGVPINPYMRRATGGPVSPGQPYIVGEVGEELFVPNMSGNIIPNSQMGRQVVHNHYNTFNVAAPGNTSVSARKSARELADMYLGYVQGART